MSAPPTAFVLEGVPPIRNLEHPDIFLDTLAIAATGSHNGIFERSDLLRACRLQLEHRDGFYGTLSAVTGRGWRIGTDEAVFYPEGGIAAPPPASFAVVALGASLTHQGHLEQAIASLGRPPQAFRSGSQDAHRPPGLPTGLLSSAEPADRHALTRCIVGYLAKHRRPVLALLHLPRVPVTEFALLTGYEQSGTTLLGRYPTSTRPSPVSARTATSGWRTGSLTWSRWWTSQRRRAQSAPRRAWPALPWRTVCASRGGARAVPGITAQPHTGIGRRRCSTTLPLRRHRELALTETPETTTKENSYHGRHAHH